MKKFLLLLLALTITLTLIACNNETTSEKNKNNSEIGYAKTYDEFINILRRSYTDLEYQKFVFHEKYWEFMLKQSEKTEEEIFKEIKENMDATNERQKEQFGNNIKREIEVVKKEKLSAEKIKEIDNVLNSHAKQIGFTDYKSITEGYLTTIKTIIKGDKSEESADRDLYIVKCGNFWCGIGYNEESNTASFN